jgi:hypothetical protein
LLSENAASELGWHKQGVAKRPKWADHHCPRGHAWKADCFARGHCKLCPIHPALGVLPMHGQCPACGEKVDADDREVKAGPQAPPKKAKKTTPPRRFGPGRKKSPSK